MDVATTGSDHGAVTPPEMSMNPPTPPAGPVPVPYPYLALSSSAKKTSKLVTVHGKPILVLGSVMKLEPPANQPSQPTGGDVVTHGVKGQAKMVSASSRTKAGGKGVCKTEDKARMNLLTEEQAVAQATVPLLRAGGDDGAGGADGGGAGGDKYRKRAIAALKAACPPATKVTEPGHPVDACSGWVVDRQTDIKLSGRIPFAWSRTYRSAQAAERNSLGVGGWTHSYDQWVVEEETVITVRAEDGRDIWFPKVAPGHSVFHRRERLTLTAERNGGYSIVDVETRTTRSFERVGGRCILRRIADPYGSAVQLDYSGDRLARIIDTAGREVRVLSDANGRITRLEVWMSTVENAARLELWFDYAYHADGELARAQNALGFVDSFEYDAQHRMVKTTLKNGVSFYYEYDPESGWCTKTWGDGDLHLVELDYDFAKKTTIITGTNEVRKYVWNSDGVVVHESTPDGIIDRSKVFDEDLYLLEESNGAGETTSYKYDERGNCISITDPAGNITKWEYSNDCAVKRIGPTGLVTTFAHDGGGRLVGIGFPTGLSYTIARDALGRVTGLYGQDGMLAGRSYDRHHCLVEYVGSRRGKTRYEYDSLGRQVRRVDPLGRQTRAEYDRLGHPVAIHFPDGTTTLCEYEALGRPSQFTNALGHVTRLEYSGTGVLAKLTLADGGVWSFGYTNDERLSRVVNPRSEQYEFDYDRAGRVERERTFDQRELVYRYSKAENLARVDYPDDTYRKFFHDPLGNVIEEHSPHGTITLSRDRLGRLEKAVVDEYGGRVVNEFERDEFARVLSEKQNGRAIRYEYDSRARRSARILPDGETTRYYYDAAGSVTLVDHDGHRTAMERDIVGREQRRHIERAHVDIQSGYDAMGRLLDQRVTAPAVSGGEAFTVLSQRRWHYDPNGRVIGIDDLRWGRTAYQYDEIGQLVRAMRGSLDEVFEYDGAGSLLNALSSLHEVGRSPSAWSTRTGNLLTHTPEARYEYDARGRRTKKIDLDAEGNAKRGEVTTYVWDCRDRLREVRLPSGDRVLYTYDAFARRVRKQIVPAARFDGAAMVKLALAEGRSALPKSRVIEFLWDSNSLAEERDNERGTRVHVHDPGTLVPMLQAEQGGVFAVVNDHLGMPKELIDEDGRVAWAAAHSAWGTIVEASWDQRAKRRIESPFRLLGQYADEETGLCCTRFRYFDGATGRWLSPDPLGILGEGNLFAYVVPTTDVDPFGLAKPFQRGTYSSLNGPDDRNDNQDAHEILQNAWLIAHGEADLRPDNPSIALPGNRWPGEHQTAGKMQGDAALNDPDVRAAQSAKDNIDANVAILKAALMQHGMSASEADAIGEEMRQRAMAFAALHGCECK